VPFIRYARDKRGYESTFVMHSYRSGHGTGRARVLYLFHTPSNMKVGRQALEPEVMEALEHTHPDLAFDWTSLLREPAVAHFEPRERAPRPGQDRPPIMARPAPELTPAVIEIEDESTLGRVVGGREAARLRARYNELLQRIARRARTPEDRERLSERAMRLNPDDWPDQAAVQAAVGSVEAEWDVIANELPPRRRGRRGGRFSGGRTESGGRTAPPLTVDAAASGIISEEGDTNEDSEQVLYTGATSQDPRARDTGDGGGLGPDADPATDATNAPAARANGAGEGGVPGGS